MKDVPEECRTDLPEYDPNYEPKWPQRFQWIAVAVGIGLMAWGFLA